MIVVPTVKLMPPSVYKEIKLRKTAIVSATFDVVVRFRFDEVTVLRHRSLVSDFEGAVRIHHAPSYLVHDVETVKIPSAEYAMLFKVKVTDPKYFKACGEEGIKELEEHLSQKILNNDTFVKERDRLTRERNGLFEDPRQDQSPRIEFEVRLENFPDYEEVEGPEERYFVPVERIEL